MKRILVVEIVILLYVGLAPFNLITFIVLGGIALIIGIFAAYRLAIELTSSSKYNHSNYKGDKKNHKGK